MSQPSISWWQKYGTLAQMAQAAVALLGFVAILFQINEIRSNTRMASARQVFWAIPIWRSGTPNSRCPITIRSRRAAATRGFNMRVSCPIFSMPARRPPPPSPAEPEWQASCDYDLKPHLPFLCEKNQAEPAYLATYSADTQRWVKASMTTASVTPPDCKLGKT